MGTTARLLSALRASSRRPASLSLAEGRRRPDTRESGDSSVSYLTGSGKPRPLLDTEYLWELRGSNAYRVFNRMRMSDPKVAGLRFAQSLPLLRASVVIEPADAKDKDAVAKAELVTRLLVDDFPWRAFLADTTLALDYGFAAFEIVWRIEDGEARCRLAYRPSASIAANDIFIIDGKIDRVIQRPQGGGQCEIPGDRLLWFAHCKEGDDFRGRSILRPMYKPWKLKQEIEVQLAVLIGKMGGVPVFTEHGTLDAETQATLDEAGASFGIASGAFVRKPEDVDLELLASNAKVGEVLEAIKYWDSQLTSVAQAQVLDLGVNHTGSRALGTTMLDMFSDSLQAQASYREDVLNTKGGVIHQLVAYNCPRDDNLPKLRFGNVQKADIKAMAGAFASLKQAGMNLGEETWDWVRAELNLPESTTTQVAMPGDGSAAPQLPAAPEPSAPPPAQGSGTAVEDGAQASEAPHSCDHTCLKLSELRPAVGAEVYLDLAEITAQFDNGKTAIKEATQATREALARELVRRATAAQAKGKLAAFAASSPPMLDKLTSEIEKVLLRFYEAGRLQVAAELERQKQVRPWSPDEVRASEVRLAEAPSPEGLVALKQQASAMGRAFGQAMLSAAAMQAARTAARTPVDAATMVAMVMRESDATAVRLAGVVSDLMNMGRADQAKEQKQDIKEAVYSAILDSNLCPVCEAREGDSTTDIDEAETWTPNPDCDGGSNCRCMTIFVYRTEGT